MEKLTRLYPARPLPQQQRASLTAKQQARLAAQVTPARERLKAQQRRREDGDLRKIDAAVRRLRRRHR